MLCIFVVMSSCFSLHPVVAHNFSLSRTMNDLSDDESICFFHDLLSNNIGDETFIYVGFGDDVKCKLRPCEHYSRNDLEASLIRRGVILNTDYDISFWPELLPKRKYNSGSSNKNVFVLRFAEFTKNEEKILRLV